MTLTQQQLQSLPVFGIAGNFAEHLGQAGEDADFVNIQTEEENAPKGMFPIYIPGNSTYLGTYPLSNQSIQADFSRPINLQMEPEICVLFDVSYYEQQVTQVKAKAFSAFNDCSIRRPNAKKISQKKNWGTASTGLSNQWIEIDRFEKGGILDNYHITSYLKRDNEIKQYGVDSPVLGYNYFYQKLSRWIVSTLNNQSDFGPLENLTDLLKQANYPEQIIVTLGATRYTEFGETGFLKVDDKIGIFIYDQTHHTSSEIPELFQHPEKIQQDFSGSALIQSVSEA
ncbi:DUF5718 family protein [Hydrogenovibrio sp. 3SP14C1]|uniref:DUF5718 family protein n=1 Tax=Hydrogenovibrio sp. 3SP14C1 TaxID=3038774 RepID=UPI002416316E|nr:DUF5718 family protein [Hydrogenovibrio sp. 3SP14C1]MDG4812164.1 DUF5718 family protein [Hydrogenovibrio sp. 3SP14C1]